MTLVVITLIVLAIAVCDTHRRVRNIETTTNSRVSDLRNDVKTILQDIADKMDVDNAEAENADKRIFESLAAIDTKVYALGQATGFQLENGLWQKIVVKKPASTSTPKAQPTKTTAKRGAK